MAMVAGAQAQSSVTVYGGLDVSYSSTDKNNAGASTTQGDSALYSSRLGFKGTEDLGGGLKAEFALEAPLTTSNGNSGALKFTRASWVGLTDAKLGSIKMGLMDMTYAEGLDSTVGQMGNLSNVLQNLGSDQGSTIQYTTPTFAGLTAQVAYANSSTATDGETTSGKKLTSAAVSYNIGKLTVIAGQTEAKISATYDQKETSYGVSYDFGFAKVGVAQTTVDANTQANTEAKMTRFSVSAPVAALGAGVTAHAVYFKDDTTNDGDVIIVDKTAKAVDGYKLALSKAFSKRTTGYVAYVDQSDNKAGQTTNDSKSYSVGVVHTF